MEQLIDYRKISDSIDFYQEKGFEYIEVPWSVSEKAINITGNNFNNYQSELGFHVASAEQSFLEMILRKELKEGRYVACSPCFRNEEVDEIHSKYFMKVELIDFLGYNLKEEAENLQERFYFVLNSAKLFFERYLEVEEERTNEGVDLLSPQEIELGSYGIREYDNFSWIYGTGVAEPRLSYCLNGKRGYHLKDIPRGQVGELSKIEEEVLELKDSISQSNKILQLNELADILGSIEEFLNDKFDGISFEDLIKMKDVTKRAFLSGRRK